MVQKGIIKGYSDGTFKPDQKVTYAEFIKMVDIAITGKDAGNFTDGGQWYKNYYDTAVASKLFTAGQIPYTVMDNSIPRSYMALIVSNAIDVKYDAKLVNNLSDITSSDTDILEAYGSGIITGYPDGTFKPTGVLTRAESATVLWRLTDESQRVTSN